MHVTCFQIRVEVWFYWTLYLVAKNSAKITQTHIRGTSYHSIKLHLKQVFQSVYRHELETKLSQKPWKQKTAKIPDWPRRNAVPELRLCVRHDCLGTRLHRIAIRPDPNCMLCSLRKPTDRNHLGQCTALFNRTVSDTGRQGQKWWKINFVLSLLLSFATTPYY
jgi:hypothetical protein